MHAEHAVNTIRANPRLAHLLEKSGIKLQCNYMLPSSPTICEEWWDEAERLIKKRTRRERTRLNLSMTWDMFMRIPLQVKMMESMTHDE
jgi:hypothetical protein